MRRILVAMLALVGLSTAAPEARAAVPGGTVRFLAAGDIDYLDPGMTYYTFGFAVQGAVNRTLYAFKPGDGVTPVPDLASGPPEIAPDQRTVTVKLRPGVRYAPPVDREIRAGDIKYAIERSFMNSVPSGYATAYFTDLEGAPSRPRRSVSISGIVTPDDHTLVFRLRRPVAHRFAASLVLPITTPVPPELARRHDRKRESTYDDHVAFTGPYRVTVRTPGQRIELVRNPNWDRATDFRPAYADRIVIDEGHWNLARASERTLAGSGMLCCDAQPPAGVVKRAVRERPDQVTRVPSGGTRWIALNTRIAPFDDVNIRRGVIAGMNRQALRSARGGELAGPIAQHYLPPGIPGFEESGGLAGFTDLAFMSRPRGDRGLARVYFKRAKRKIPRKRLLVVATNAEPGRSLAKVAARQLRRLGFRLRVRRVPQDAVYTYFCGVPRAQVAICPNVGWFRDFHDPESLLAPTFKASAIRAYGNVNWSQLRVPAIDRAMQKAALVPPGPERWRAWARVNRKIVEQAPGVPYVWDEAAGLASADIDGAVNPYTTTWDLTFTGLRQ